MPSELPNAEEERLVTAELERRVGVTLDNLAALVLLESIRGFGPQKFLSLHVAGLQPGDVLADVRLLPMGGKTGERFREAIMRLGGEEYQLARARAARQLVRAAEHDARIATYTSPEYPRRLLATNNAVPILYLRGASAAVHASHAVACVGSRRIRHPYDTLHHAFARHAAGAAVKGSVVSGFALGADTIGHTAALEAGGHTVLVMPCGLDRPFPPENRGLWRRLLDYPGASIVSEFPFGTAASSLTLRKRNKMIVSLADGVLLSQSSADGGAMNAYRFALEQRKAVATFAADGTPDTSGNQLIAEHPDQPQLDAPPKPANTTFPLSPEPDAWSAWLSTLWSST